MIILSLILHAQTIKGDTLNVSNPKINFIKIDGVLYQLKRTTTLEKVEKSSVYQQPFLYMQSDTLSRIHFSPYNQGNIIQPLTLPFIIKQ
jgi:hypothetical protein